MEQKKKEKSNKQEKNTANLPIQPIVKEAVGEVLKAEEEKGPKNNAGDISEHPKQELKAQESFLSQIQMLLPLIPVVGIFTALSYFLGRLQVGSYYYALGITPNALKFDTNDYMFSSFYLVLMCLVISIWLYIFWRHSKSSKVINNKYYLYLSLLFVLAGVSLIISPHYSSSFLIGFTAIISGNFYGLLLYTFALYLQGSIKKQPKDSGNQQNSLIVVIIVLVVIFFFALLPMVTQSIARLQAENDKSLFPKVIVICNDELPIQLQNSSSNSTNIVEGQLVITNNEITYVLQSDNAVYAIPVDSIENIKYMKK